MALQANEQNCLIFNLRLDRNHILTESRSVIRKLVMVSTLVTPVIIDPALVMRLQW